jgi:[acyl-carrier-protein] S-malonyltransferase
MCRWLDDYAESSALLDRATDAGFDVRDCVFNGPAERLDRTENTQPALLTMSVATLELLKARRIPFDAVAGHSLGEYSALVAAEVLPFEAALELTRRRGELMAEAGKDRPAGMLAIIGLEVDILEAVCEEASHEDEIVTVANYNCPGQIVISGDNAALSRAADMAKAAGAKRIVSLRVSSAFHSPLMSEAEDEMREHIENVSFAAPRKWFYANVTGHRVDDEADIRHLLIRQTTHPVRWEQTIREMHEDGVRRFVEVGPGKVLAGLVRRIVSNAQIWTTDTREAFEEVTHVLSCG